MKKQTKNTRQIAKSPEFLGTKTLSPIIGLENFLLSFLSDWCYFASWHQCGCYIRQTTKHMPQSSENAYRYYFKLLLGLAGANSNFLIQYLRINI